MTTSAITFKATDNTREVRDELGCAAGIPYNRRTTTTIDLAGVVTNVVEFVDSVNVVTGTMPVGFTLGSCSVAVNDDWEILCDTLTSFLRRYTRNTTGTVTTITDTTLDGTTVYVPVGLVSVCRNTEVNPTILGSINRVTGSNILIIPAGARSVTVTVLAATAANPYMHINGAPLVVLPAGITLSWGVERGGPVGEALTGAYSFQGDIGTDFIVTTTR
jgi:hypothetical protein